MYNYGSLFEYIAQTVLKDRPIVADLYSNNEFMLTNSRVVTRLMNQALHVMAIDTQCIIDSSTPSVAYFNLDTFNSRYALHASILSVKDVAVEDADGNFWRLQPMQAFRLYSAHEVTIPRGYAIIPHENALILDGVPTTENLTARLIVSRKSLVTFDPIEADDDQTAIDEKKARVSDVPDQYQDRIEDYIAAKLLKHRDVDKNALKEAELARQAWQESLDEIKREVYSWQLSVTNASYVRAI